MLELKRNAVNGASSNCTSLALLFTYSVLEIVQCLVSKLDLQVGMRGIFQGLVTRILQYGDSIVFCENWIKHSFGSKERKCVNNSDYLIKFPHTLI